MGTPVLQNHAQKHAAAPTSTGKHRIDGRHVEQTQNRRCLHKPAQRSLFQRAGEVDQGARGTRAGDGVANHALVRRQEWNVSPADAGDLPARLSGRDHVDRAEWTIPKSQERRGGAVGNHGPVTTRKDGGEHAPVPSDPGMTDHKGTPEDRMEPTGGHAVFDRGIRHAHLAQLLPRHDPVLMRSQRCHPPPLPAPAVPFTRYAGIRSSGTGIRPHGPRGMGTPLRPTGPGGFVLAFLTRSDNVYM